MIERQLRNTGVFETVRIRHQGYAVRLKFAAFLERYKIVGFAGTAYIPADAESCEMVLTKVVSTTGRR